MTTLLKIRYLQLYRELVKAGWWAVLVALVIYVMLVIKIVRPSVALLQGSELIMLFSIIVFSINSIRKDKRLLKQIFPESFKKYLFLEYTIFSLPITIPYLFSNFPIGIIIFLFACLLIVQLNFSAQIKLNNQSILLKKFIAHNNFEWIAGMRKNQYLIILLYLFGIVISYWHFAGFITLGVITFLFSEFYNTCESQFVLTLEENNSRNFIISKLKLHLWQYTKIILPFLLCYFIHYPDKWIFYLPLLFVYYANFMVFILNKYKSYIPNTRLHSNIIIVGLCFLGMFVPYLFPISIVLVFVFYGKSITNLKAYFHA
jgi:hypothetical protein